MTVLTNPRIIRRFIILMAVATFVMFSVWAAFRGYFEAVPGDYEVRQGDILLGDRKYDQALERFTAALDAAPDHRGALMGRAIAFLESGRHEEAEAEFTYLIDFLTHNVAPDDATGIGVLAGAYANRGILYDRTERYEKALADYTRAIEIDEGAVEGPDLVHRILYVRPKPATVSRRAEYLRQQLALPEGERLLRIPELDAEQRMHKP
ncbi:MAG: tetratricopeptide repeat protein [Rhodospirillales bacterium]